MFTDSAGRKDIPGLASIMKVFAVLYLCYLSIYKNIKIPGIIFLLFGLGSGLFNVRLQYLLKSDYMQTGVKPRFPYVVVENYFTFIICLITAVYIWVFQ
jgi:hypothetical protein